MKWLAIWGYTDKTRVIQEGSWLVVFALKAFHIHVLVLVVDIGANLLQKQVLLSLLPLFFFFLLLFLQRQSFCLLSALIGSTKRHFLSFWRARRRNYCLRILSGGLHRLHRWMPCVWQIPFQIAFCLLFKTLCWKVQRQRLHQDVILFGAESFFSRWPAFLILGT